MEVKIIDTEEIVAGIGRALIVRYKPRVAKKYDNIIMMGFVVPLENCSECKIVAEIRFDTIQPVYAKDVLDKLDRWAKHLGALPSRVQYD